MVQTREFVDDEDEVKVHATEDIEEGEISSDEEGEIKGEHLLESLTSTLGSKTWNVVWSCHFGFPLYCQLPHIYSTV